MSLQFVRGGNLAVSRRQIKPLHRRALAEGDRSRDRLHDAAEQGMRLGFSTSLAQMRAAGGNADAARH
ncbi:hypothetical protein ACXHXG_14495 [Rhizobium sp. LEGMi198b]